MDGEDDDILSSIEEKFNFETLIYIPAINNVLLQRTFVLYNDKDQNEYIRRIVNRDYDQKSKLIKMQRYSYISSEIL